MTLPALPMWAKKQAPPVGLIAASVGDDVAVVEPRTGTSQSFASGPVAWLYPAPGGVLYAPDLVNGRTTVIDLRGTRVREVLDGVTMPHFGELADRYVAVSGSVLLVSYPERALIATIDTEIEHPWQVEVEARDRVLLVLERELGGSEVWLAAVMLDEGRPVYRRRLSGDIRRFAVSNAIGLLAVADAAANAVRLVDPATAAPLAEFDVPGQPLDLVFANEGSWLLTAIDVGAGEGLLTAHTFRRKKDGGVERRERWRVSLAGVPKRVVLSPDGRHAAVALASGRLEIIHVKRQELVATAQLATAPRDVVWADPAVPGPLLPEWSDQKPPELDLGVSGPDFLEEAPK